MALLEPRPAGRVWLVGHSENGELAAFPARFREFLLGNPLVFRSAASPIIKQLMGGGSISDISPVMLSTGSDATIQKRTHSFAAKLDGFGADTPNRG
jgi:hypothetical protein